MTYFSHEHDRIREAYKARDSSVALVHKYSSARKDVVARWKEIDTIVMEKLKKHFTLPLSDLRLLEVGCGSGAVIRKFEEYGFHKKNLYGLDLSTERLQRARSSLKEVNFLCGTAGLLPFSDDSFDVCSVFTLFSSILDSQLQREAAQELMRVLRPGGVLIYYDFIWNPVNRNTRGVSFRELVRLFAGRRVFARKVSLAPPLARLLSPLPTFLSNLFCRFSFLKTHYIAFIDLDSR